MAGNKKSGMDKVWTDKNFSYRFWSDTKKVNDIQNTENQYFKFILTSRRYRQSMDKCFFVPRLE